VKVPIYKLIRPQYADLNFVLCKLIRCLFFAFTKVGDFTLSKTIWLEKLNFSQQLRKFGLFLFFVIAFSGIFLIAKISQNLEWVEFADRRSFIGVPNFGDVVSNIFIVWIAISGLRFVWESQQKSNAFEFAWERISPAVFFFGVLAKGLGSMWFHIEPNVAGIIWDQLPMTFVFLGIFGILIGDRIRSNTINELCGPLLFLTATSAGWWVWVKVNGDGLSDLGPYLFVQFFPSFTMSMVLIFFPGRYTHERDYWMVLVFYACSGFFGAYDWQTFDILKILSGQSIEHVLLAGGAWQLLSMFQKRKRDLFKAH
jgi:hypothetical protein